jgi:glycosyltransferase involved in cell wall biosynthesis
MADNDFDWEFYVLFNNDIKESFGNFKYAALLHYNMYGKHENRITNIDMFNKAYPYMMHFDHEYYRVENEDLINIDNKYMLMSHYLFQGCKENRKINFNTSIFLYFNFPNITPINHRPKVSIIMPVFNRGHLLSRAIESILSQTYDNIELIIVDDNSNEETKNILNTFKDNIKITIITNKKNYGCYVSINLALNLCNGTYITIHGSDDISLHDRFMRLINLMLQKNLLMCGNYILRSHIENFNNMDILNSREIFEKIVTQNLSTIAHSLTCCKPIVSLGTLIYHKSVFDKLSTFENIRKGGDMVFFEKYLKTFENITFTHDDCSHRYLTKYLIGKQYEIFDEILYISANMDKENITSQDIPFNINKYRT